MKILITGGTGTIGAELVRQMIHEDITIFSRNERSQVEMQWAYPKHKYILGDVRDASEVLKACEGMDYVFHFAALKHIEICEQQPQEAIKTNILGTLNVINACQRYGCRLVNMSSDKAINPTSVYGRTKALTEAMINQSGFVSIRSGNVLWSSGSVLQVWEKQLKTDGSISLTSKEMTRFFVHPSELVQFILSCKDDVGTFTIPMKSFRLIDIAEEFGRRHGRGGDTFLITFTGLRAGERLHEFRDENTSSEENICTDLNYIFQCIPMP